MPPKIRRRRRKNNHGAVLIGTIIILIFLSVLGMNLMVYLLSRTTAATLELDRLKAYYLAEAGIAGSVHELKQDKDFDNNGVGNVAWRKLNDGVFKAVHNFQNSTITGIGQYNKIKRTVQIKYKAL